MGDTLTCSGPAGNFYVNPLVHDATIVAIAGGSGVTPFMSMIRRAVDYGSNETIFLFYGNRDMDDVIFHEELTRITQANKNIRYIPVIESPPKDYTGRRGYISADVIKAEIGDVSGKTFFLCGPQAMYDFCLPELEKLKVPGRKIRREMYGAPTAIDRISGLALGRKRGAHRFGEGSRQKDRYGPGDDPAVDDARKKRDHRTVSLPLRRVQHVPGEALERASSTSRPAPRCASPTPSSATSTRACRIRSRISRYSSDRNQGRGRRRHETTG